jgi:hypothetical protein
MILGSTQPLTEMSTRNLPRGKGQPAHKADNLTAIFERIVYKMWVTGIALLYLTLPRWRSAVEIIILSLGRTFFLS